MTSDIERQLETEEAMFVQTAQGIDSAGGNLTLRGSRRRRCTSPTGRSGAPST